MMDDGWASHDDFDDLDGILDDMNDSFDGVPLRDASTTSAIRNDNAGGERSRRLGGGGYDDRWSSVDGGADDDDDDYFREDDDDEDDERHDNIHNNHSSHSSNNNNNNNNGGTSLFSGFGFGSHANPPPSSSSEMPPWSSAPSNPTRTTGGLGDGGTISRNAHRHDLNLTWTLTRPPPPTTTSTTTRPTSMPFASSEFTVPGSLETTSPPSLRIGAASGTEGTPSAAGAFDDDDLRGASEENGTAETTGRDAFAGWPPRPDGRRDEPFATTFRDAEGEDAAVEGWDDIPDSDDLSRDGEENGNADGEITGERRDETAPVPSGRGTFLLGRAAERFGAALLASVDGGGEGEEQEYNDDEEEEEEEKEEEEYGVHRNKGDDEQSHDEEEDGRENVTGQDCNDDVDGREERRITLDDDNDDDDTGDASKSGYGGFGGGFVMSRLSRFLEVATAPVERDDDDDDFDEDGWEDDDDNLDFGDDGLEEEAGDAVKDDGRERHDDEKDDPAKPPSAGEEYDDVERAAAEEDPMISTEGWDDDIMDADISTDDMDGTASRPSEMASLSTRETTTSSTPRHSVLPPMSSRPPLAPATSSNTPSEPFATPPPPPPSTTTKQTHSTPTASNPKPNDDISDSIQSLVAITESALDSELSNFSWKTPRKETDDGEDDVIVSGARVSDYGRETTDQDGMGVGPDILEGDSEYRDDANGEDAMDGSKTEPLAVASNPPIDTAESAAKDTAEDGDVPKSLSDFANALNAELDSFFDDPEDGQEEVQPNPCVDGDALGEWGKSIDRNSMKTEASTSMDTFQENLQPKESPVQNQQPKESPAPNDKASYDYELSKNKSPEPVRGSCPEHPTLPHQQSWYINAMEDGKGGVVYNGTEMESDKPKHPEKRPIIDPVASTHDNESSLQHTPVGMPLSEMPSRSTSPPISSNSEHSFKHSELQCQCLELILPFPENGNVKSQEPGYGTKKLPDGNIVLVNYEQLLQNEATKRILLQRSIDTFERTIEKLDARNEASRKWAKEQEDAKREADAQLVSAHEEIAQLKDVVAQLRLEIDAEKKRAPGSEARLFEEELAASKTQKDELRLEVESLKRELERKNDLCNKFEASQKSLEVALEEIRDEKRRLQSELSESHATAEKLKDTCESLQAQCDGLNVRVEELVSANTSSKDAEELAERMQSTVDSLENDMSEKTKEIEDLKRQLSHSEANQSNITFERNKFQGECTRLDSELSEMKSKLVSLQEEKEAIRSMNTKYEAQIAELNATIESMDDEAVEKDKLAAEVASLKYDLGMKTTECEEAAESLKLLQTKLDCAEARISESSATPSSETLSNVTEPLKAEIEMLEKKLSNSAKALADAENLKAELERKLEDSRRTVVGLETEVKSLHAEVNEVSNLREELNTVKKSLEDTQVKFNELSLSRDQLEVDRNEHDEHVSLLQSTISDLDKQVFSLREEYAELLTTFEDNKRKYKEEHSLMTKRYVILAEEEQKLKVELDDLKEQYDELSKTTSETISKYEQQVLELQGENLEVSAALEVARKNTTNSEELLETKEKLRQEQSRSKDLQNVIEIASSEKDALLKKIDDLRQELESVSREKTHIAQTLEARASAAEHRNNLLNIESATLQKANAESSQTIAKLNEELLVLKEANAKLESKLFDMSFDADQSSALAEENLKLRNERDQLKNEAASFMEKINQMSSQMKSSAAETTDSFSADERDSLLSRISELEEALKNDNLNDLRDELTSLHEERQELDADNEELLVQLGLMQQNEEEMQAELSEMREQVESLETQCKRLQLDLDESRKAIKSSDESTGTGSGMEELRTENAKLCSEIVQLNNERTSLENRIDELQRQLENFEQMSNQDKEVVKGNIETYHLREKLDNLELQLAKRDKELAAMKEEFQSKLDVKDKKISELSSEKCSLENNIKDISKKEELKNAELDSLHQQVETLRIENEQVADPNLGADVAEEEKEFDDVGDIQDLLAEDVDSDDYLRRQIVVLALALERSEMQRADAIERVVKERKSNAESLKQLGESVKRFYSAVRCSDALSFL